MHTDYTGQGVDQLKEVIVKIKDNPDDRRIILSAWNPIGIICTESLLRLKIYKYVPSNQTMLNFSSPTLNIFKDLFFRLP